jgi:hypothetical protein
LASLLIPSGLQVESGHSFAPLQPCMQMNLRLCRYCRLLALNCSVLAKKTEVGLLSEQILLADLVKPRQVEMP